ncbi:MAG TPA: serine hydrolase [Vicinamibacterales bacterium]|nr:serine hydrolase [Vicinamibacterales bacterium]
MYRFRLFFVRILTVALSFGLFAPAAEVSAASSTTTQKRSTVTSSKSKKKAPRYSASKARARRAKLARARAAARAREAARLRAWREAMTPRFRTDESGALIPDIRAAAAIVMNAETGEILYETNAQDKRSIASITKVMTALVFLEDDPDLSQTVVVTRPDVKAASTTFLRVNERLTLEDVLHLTLIASDNAAARILSRVSHGGTPSFIARMNEKAIELGLQNTTFADPSGLDADNVSSAYDLSRLIAYAAGDERISAIMRKPDYRVTTSRRAVTIHSTNRLLARDDIDVRGGKTGFIGKAGYCIATLVRLPHGEQVAVVILGARSNTLRFAETRHLFNWLKDKASAILGTDKPQ